LSNRTTHRIEADEDRLSKLLSELEGKDINTLISEGSSKLASVPSGGGAAAVSSGGGAAAGSAAAPAELVLFRIFSRDKVLTDLVREEKKEEKKEEEVSIAFDLLV